MGRSLEFTWLDIIGIRYSYRHFHVSLGLGIDWRNYVTKGQVFFSKQPDGTIILTPYADGTTDRRSRIKTFNLQLPLLFDYKCGRNNHWCVTAGGILNFNTHASLLTEFTLADKHYSISTSDIGQRPVTVDAYLAVGYRDFGLFARFSPMNQMKTSTGLDFSTFSTGITLIF